MTEITHKEICDAADYAGQLDYESRLRDSGKDYAEGSRLQLSLGAFRAFEWLKKNGFKVEKE